jgi:hypothetical protein
MARPLSDSMRAPGTPDSVEIRSEAREPTFDPRAGTPALPAAAAPPAAHRLVVVGDSLAQGFMSGAIHETKLCFPKIIAWEMGWDDRLRVPTYGGPGGLPLNLEYLVRRLEQRFGARMGWWEIAAAGFEVRQAMDEIEDWWERGPGSDVPALKLAPHNLSVYGWDLRDALSRTADHCRAALQQPKDDWLAQVVENANDRAALYVLDPASRAAGRAVSPLEAAEELGRVGGIETLIVLLGANNALPAVVHLDVRWSRDPDYRDLARKSQFTVWDPEHFEAELREVEAAVRRIDARHVIFGTVPHVTIAPLARGVGQKVARGSRYFPYYTRPWIRDQDFDPKDDRCITEQQARAIDSAIDQYNQAIVELVRRARTGPRPLDWYVLDVAGLLDRLAQRRYIDDPAARPPWWTPYELPPELAALAPRPDSRFFASGPGGRIQGGLFSLDGAHPTTIGYGILAQEFINVMQLAGVPFLYGDGKTPRVGPVRVDFRRLVALDTLISDPPRSLAADLKLMGWLDEKLDVVARFLPGIGFDRPLPAPRAVARRTRAAGARRKRHGGGEGPVRTPPPRPRGGTR